jgi:hypothetical protein
MVLGTFLGLLIAAGHGQVVAPLSEVKVTVVDQSGAVIPESEVVFKSDSKTVVSHTGPEGSVAVALPTNRYTVTTSKLGFLKNRVPDFQAVAPEPNELRIVLEVGHITMCGPCPSLIPAIPTATSDLPNVIQSEPNPTSSAQPATKKVRSLRCLYLWKCSTS